MKKFCAKCYRSMLKKGLIKETDDIDNIIFRCNIVLGKINAYGDYVKLRWNCDKQEYEEIKDIKENEHKIN